MKRLLLLVTIVLVSGSATAQTTINGSRTILGAWDASGATSTKACKAGTAAPGTCAIGECFFDTDATAGANILLCTGVDTWTAISGAALDEDLVDIAALDCGTTGLVLGWNESTNDWECQTDDSGAGGGDPLLIAGGAVADVDGVDFIESSGDLDWTLATGASPDTAVAAVRDDSHAHDRQNAAWMGALPSNFDSDQDGAVDAKTWAGFDTAGAVGTRARIDFRLSAAAGDASGAAWSSRYNVWLVVWNKPYADSGTNCQVAAYRPDGTLINCMQPCADGTANASRDWESMTVADPNSDSFYLSGEQNNRAIREYSISALLTGTKGAEMTVVKEWTGLPTCQTDSSTDNYGWEGMAFVPDPTYCPTNYQQMPCGWFAMWCQSNGDVYRVTLDTDGGGTAATPTDRGGTLLDPCNITDTKALDNGGGLDYDRSTGLLWLGYGGVSGGAEEDQIAAFRPDGTCVFVSDISSTMDEQADLETIAIGPSGQLLLGDDADGYFSIYSMPGVDNGHWPGIAQTTNKTGMTFKGATSGETALIATAAASGTLTLRAGTGTVVDTGCTDCVSDAMVANGITASNYLPLAGGTLTAEVTVDDLGLEFAPGDTMTTCANFSTTGGGIFYDDSEGKLKKCQDNVLTDLDTGGAGATSYRTITIGWPTNSENVYIFTTEVAITIAEIDCVVVTSSADFAVDFNLYHGTDRSAAGTAVNGSTMTINDEAPSGKTAGDEWTSFGAGDATLDAAEMLWLKTSGTVVGTVEEMGCTIRYTE